MEDWAAPIVVTTNVQFFESLFASRTSAARKGDAIEDIKTAFNSAVRRVYLTEVTSHTLKHTAATWLMQSGKDRFKTSDFLATSVATLLKHYGQRNPDHQNEIADAIGVRPENVRRIVGSIGRN